MEDPLHARAEATPRHDADQSAPDQPDELLTPGQVARLFGVDPKTVTRWASAGKLTALHTLGGHRRYRSTEVHDLLERQRRTT